MKATTRGMDRIVKLLAPLGALTLCSLAVAQTTFQCGSVGCVSVNPWDTSVITGINDLNVRGELFDVSFSTTAAKTPDRNWGSVLEDAPPSFGPLP
jgi:hypothetical protein